MTMAVVRSTWAGLTIKGKLFVVACSMCAVLLVVSGVSDKIQNYRYERQTDALTTQAQAAEAASLKAQGEAEGLHKQVTSLQEQLKSETERRIAAESELAQAHINTESKRRIYEKTRNASPRPIGNSDADLRAAAEALGIRP